MAVVTVLWRGRDLCLGWERPRALRQVVCRGFLEGPQGPDCLSPDLSPPLTVWRLRLDMNAVLPLSREGPRGRDLCDTCVLGLVA